MDCFSEYVKHLAADQGLSISYLKEVLGWPYAKCRSIKIGTLKAQQLSFQDAVDLADVLCVSLSDLAEAARMQ